VSQQGVERTLGKLLTDPAFRERFFAEPGLACWEAGLQLTAVELEALSAISRAGLLHVAGQLDSAFAGLPRTLGFRHPLVIMRLMHT
jgi:hypothetical protein